MSNQIYRGTAYLASQRLKRGFGGIGEQATDRLLSLQFNPPLHITSHQVASQQLPYTKFSTLIYALSLMVYKRSKQREEVDYGQQLRQQRVNGSVSWNLICLFINTILNLWWNFLHRANEGEPLQAWLHHPHHGRCAHLPHSPSLCGDKKYQGDIENIKQKIHTERETNDK